MVRLKELRRSTAQRLALIGNDSPLADVDCILQSFGFDKNDLILGDKTVDAKHLQEFEQKINRLELGEPVQYIVGECEFMSLMFEVNPATLIPRSDTEVLVEEVAKRCSADTSVKIAEVGSGSGCIAISLARILPDSQVISVDISKTAIGTAKRNAKRCGVSNRVEFVWADIKKGFPKTFEDADVIVSNPPYIPGKEVLTLDKKVRDFEPRTALDGGEDGLDFYRIITRNAPLKKNGLLAFEVGMGQADAVKTLMTENGYSEIQIINDLSGIERVVIGKKD